MSFSFALHFVAVTSDCNLENLRETISSYSLWNIIHRFTEMMFKPAIFLPLVCWNSNLCCCTNVSIIIIDSSIVIFSFGNCICLKSHFALWWYRSNGVDNFVEFFFSPWFSFPESCRSTLVASKLHPTQEFAYWNMYFSIDWTEITSLPWNVLIWYGVVTTSIRFI